MVKYNFKKYVIALAMGSKRIPETSKERLEAVHNIIKATRNAGIPDQHIYIDPLVMTISTNTQNAIIFFDTIKEIRAAYPGVHFTAGISNISFGLPARSYINRTFLILAVKEGLDCAILDPLDQECKTALLTADLLLGRDQHCLNYTQAYSAGMFTHV